MTSAIGDLWHGITGKTAADASERAADTSAQYQMEALDYLKEANAPMQAAQQFGLQGLQDFYGGDQQGTIDMVQASPFYQSNIQQGEEAILRNAAATGGLRGGNVQQALAQNSQNVLQGMVGQQIGGLQSMAGLQTNANAIANQTSNIGNTYAQGQVASANAKQAGMGNIVNLGMQAASMFSDIRLKDSVVYKGNVNGHKWYEWEWNEKANELGMHGHGEGVIADEVEDYAPEYVGEERGFKTVDYKGLLNG